MEAERPHEMIKTFSDRRVLGGRRLLIGKHSEGGITVLGEHVETITTSRNMKILNRPTQNSIQEAVGGNRIKTHFFKPVDISPKTVRLIEALFRIQKVRKLPR